LPHAGDGNTPGSPTPGRSPRSLVKTRAPKRARCSSRRVSSTRISRSYLTGRKKLPSKRPAYTAFGEESEAVDYAAGAGELCARSRRGRAGTTTSVNGSRPITVNNALAAVDDFYIRRGLGPIASAKPADSPAAARCLRMTTKLATTDARRRSGHQCPKKAPCMFRG
jgi:hypothetical protein